MRAAHQFVEALREGLHLDKVEHLYADVYGSLALTGTGHGTDRAILCGFENNLPETVCPDNASSRVERILKEQYLNLGGSRKLAFDFKKHFRFHKNKQLPHHANGMHFTAYDKNEQVCLEKIFYSIGGGFIADAEHMDKPFESTTEAPYPFHDAATLFKLCREHNLTISELMLENEKAWHSEGEIRAGVLNIAKIMMDSIHKGCHNEGILPGGLEVKRRAPDLYKKLYERNHEHPNTHVGVLNWVNLYAMAVNEENAAGGRIVTAPTNGAAGIIPAILSYYTHFCKGATEQGTIDFLLTAAAIAALYKKGASISAAEVGCQGEVGVACSMAAGALTAVLGGSLMQIENAAEMAMEHNLGLTCDPIGGLVQIPCIERNTMGSVKALNCAHFALMEEGGHARVPLDKVIKTMLQTGKDMHASYKETSLGGLAKHLPFYLPSC